MYTHISGHATAAVCIGFLSGMVGQVARQISKNRKHAHGR